MGFIGFNVYQLNQSQPYNLLTEVSKVGFPTQNILIKDVSNSPDRSLSTGVNVYTSIELPDKNQFYIGETFAQCITSLNDVLNPAPTAVWGTITGTLSNQTDLQSALNNKQNSDATLNALAAYNTNGLLTQTSSDNFTGRTITGTANLITITNGNGVNGNPTINVGNNVYQVGGTDVSVTDGGTGTSTQFTSGSVVFAGPSGVYTQDNSNLFFNDTNNRLGIGTATPAYRLDTQGTIENIYGTNSEFSQKGTATLTGNNGFTIKVQGNYAYVTDLSAAVLSVIDITNPSSPAQVGSVTLAGQLRGLAIQGDYAYIASAASTNLLYVVDISNPSSPTSVGSVSITDARAVTISGKYAYVFLNNGASSSVKIVDVSIPATPTIIGTATMDNGVCGQMAVQGKYLYAGASTNNTISIFDISDPTNPTLVSGRFNTGGTFSISVSGRYLYTINTSGRLAVVDISNPATPVLVTTTTSFNGNGFMQLDGRYLYMVSSSFTLLRIIDLQDPANPIQAATINIGASPASVAIAGKYAYITYSTNPDKLTIFELSGIETSALRTPTISTGAIEVTENANVIGNLTVGTALTVGGEGIYSQGILSVTKNVNINGYTKIGDLSSTPSIKTVIITGTTSSSQGNQVFVNHNIADPTKIISMKTFVDLGGGTNIYITSGYRYSSGYEFSERVDNTQIAISNVAGNSGNILSLAFKCYLIYMQ